VAPAARHAIRHSPSRRAGQHARHAARLRDFVLRSYVVVCAAVIGVATVTLTVAVRDSLVTSGVEDRAAAAEEVVAAPPAALAPRVTTVEENAKPGTPDWAISNEPSAWDKIRGFTDRVSAQRGDDVGLFVSTGAESYRVEAYRMGYYAGVGARRVWSSDELPGSTQPFARNDAATGMYDAPWARSTSITVTDDWTPGIYMLKLVSSDGGSSFVPLTIRDDDSHAAILVQSSVTTWQAYNAWGGANLYTGPKFLTSTRSRVVSFDRPYDGTGSGEYFGREDLLVTQIEAMGLDVSYTTDVDTHAHPELLLNHKVFISGAHDEYWSKEMRDGVEAARDAGVNLIFLGANASFRRIRLEPSELGPNRHEVNYRVASEDPLNNVDPVRVTTSWRDAPNPRPESAMIGNLYECNPVSADMVIGEASSWVFSGTGLKNGDKLAKLVGNEYDRVTPERPTPANIEVLAHSPVVCRGVKSFSDATYYTASSGAGVFATGTFQIEAHLGPPCADDQIHGVDCQVRKLMTNVLVTFGNGPAGVEHPSKNNLDHFGIHRGYVNPTPH
jgi:hypothetical protein